MGDINNQWTDRGPVLVSVKGMESFSQTASPTQPGLTSLFLYRFRFGSDSVDNGQNCYPTEITAFCLWSKYALWRMSYHHLWCKRILGTVVHKYQILSGCRKLGSGRSVSQPISTARSLCPDMFNGQSKQWRIIKVYSFPKLKGSPNLLQKWNLISGEHVPKTRLHCCSIMKNGVFICKGWAPGKQDWWSLDLRLCFKALPACECQRGWPNSLA